MNFSSDWVTPNIHNFKKCMTEIGEQRTNFLEIGSFEGRSTCWFLQNGLADDGSITCVDPFYPDWFENKAQLKDIFDANVNEVKKATQAVIPIQASSYQGLAKLIQQKQSFDFIYIDGDHNPATTLTDACMAWGLLRQGGVMLFDDYEYPQEPTKRGIDSFLSGFFDKYDPVLSNYQLAVRKK